MANSSCIVGEEVELMSEARMCSVPVQLRKSYGKVEVVQVVRQKARLVL